MASLYERFCALPIPLKEGEFAAEPVSETAQVRIGKRHDRAPALLLPGRPDELAQGYGVALRRIEYTPNQIVEVRSEGVVSKGDYSALVCTEAAPDFQRYFFRIVEGLLAELGESPSANEFDRGVRRIISLFRALSTPGSRSLQGLWAELLLVVHSSKPEVAIGAWHSKGTEEFDFVLGENRLDVKSSLGGFREHDVALDQLVVGQQGQTVIASILLEDEPRGASLNDLVALLFHRIEGSSDMRLRVESILASSLGDGWHNAANVTFDVQEALLSLRCFDALAVPSVARDFPAQVSKVRFRVDLSGTDPLSDEARKTNPLLTALMPDVSQ